MRGYLSKSEKIKRHTIMIIMIGALDKQIARILLLLEGLGVYKHLYPFF